ncbi:MAG: energy-coupling factor transporter transmembrane protein EcfT [Fibrobacter sp.]|nr:energy-coupling factor transporter transmembrane protein EcfT [Fibrobacter sp.]
MLDPRTKLFLILAINSLVLTAPLPFCLMLMLIPAALLITKRQFSFVVGFIVSYVISGILFYYVKEHDIGIVGAVSMAPLYLMYRMMPIGILLYYIFTTTTIGEFLSAMERMHISKKISIPLAVMFRFFPTVFDEAKSIGHAMRMRGISIFCLRAWKDPISLLEYRLIPLLVSITKISDELSIASMTRGLSPTAKRTYISAVGFHVQDVLIIAYTVAVWILYLLRDRLPWEFFA